MAAKRFDFEAFELSVRAHMRHNHTNYDELLITGHERGAARAMVAQRVAEVLETWK